MFIINGYDLRSYSDLNPSESHSNLANMVCYIVTRTYAQCLTSKVAKDSLAPEASS